MRRLDAVLLIWSRRRFLVLKTWLVRALIFSRRRTRSRAAKPRPMRVISSNMGWLYGKLASLSVRQSSISMEIIEKSVQTPRGLNRREVVVVRWRTWPDER